MDRSRLSPKERTATRRSCWRRYLEMASNMLNSARRGSRRYGQPSTNATRAVSRRMVFSTGFESGRGCRRGPASRWHRFASHFVPKRSSMRSRPIRRRPGIPSRPTATWPGSKTIATAWPRVQVSADPLNASLRSLGGGGRIAPRQPELRADQDAAGGWGASGHRRVSRDRRLTRKNEKGGGTSGGRTW